MEPKEPLKELGSPALLLKALREKRNPRLTLGPKSWDIFLVYNQEM